VFGPAPAKEDSDPAAAPAQEVADTLVGTSAQEAEKAVAAAGLTWRVIAEDGTFNAVTADYDPKRVNVELEDDKVTKATVG